MTISSFAELSAPKPKAFDPYRLADEDQADECENDGEYEWHDKRHSRALTELRPHGQSRQRSSGEHHNELNENAFRS